ncbi:MAG: FliM/FliN family flagellar motor switch protein [Verrucomicrobia bacterium]|nr:FliM/FliN family flagellar motor switch protein [Verrucomicrobiota bacterium]
MDDASETGPEGLVDVFRYRGEKIGLPEEAIIPYTFGQAASLSSSDLHRFRTHNAAVARAMAARLSLFVRAEFSMELEEVSTMTFQKYTDNAPTPCHLVLFKVEPLQGIGVLDFAPSLGLVLTDRMLGGVGAMVDPDRPLREVEQSLIDQASRILLQEWVENWKTRELLLPRLLGFENNPKFLTICDPDEEVKVLKYTATMGDVFDRVQLVLPVKMSEPLIQQLTADTDVKKKDAASKKSLMPTWNTAYDGVKLHVSAVWDDVEMLSRDLLNFKVGDFLPLKSDSFDRVEVRLADRPKFIGRLGSAAKRSAVEITKYIGK